MPLFTIRLISTLHTLDTGRILEGAYIYGSHLERKTMKAGTMKLICAFFPLMVVFLASAAEAGCAGAASEEKLAGFMRNPSSLLDLYPHGTKLMEADVMSLAGASHASLAALRALFRSANDAQAKALGQGLAHESLHCASSDPTQSRAIADLVLNAGDPRIALAFRGSVEDMADGPSLSMPGGDEASSQGIVPGVTLDTEQMVLPDPFAPLPRSEN